MTLFKLTPTSTRPTELITPHTKTALSTISPFHHDSAHLVHEHSHSVIHAPIAKAVMTLRNEIPRVEIAVIVCGVVAGVILILGAVIGGVRKSRKPERAGRKAEKERMREVRRASKADVKGKGRAIDDDQRTIDVRTRRQSAGRNGSLVEEMEMQTSPQHRRRPTNPFLDGKNAIRLESVAEGAEADIDLEHGGEDEGEYWDGHRYRPRVSRSKERRTLKEVLQENRAPTPEPVDGAAVPPLKPIFVAQPESPLMDSRSHEIRQQRSRRPRSVRRGR